MIGEVCISSPPKTPSGTTNFATCPPKEWGSSSPRVVPSPYYVLKRFRRSAAYRILSAPSYAAFRLARCLPSGLRDLGMRSKKRV